MIGSKVLIRGSILEHVVDGSEDRGGNGCDRLLGTPPRLEPQELGLQVAVLLAHGRPGALHECGLEPGGTLPQAIGSTLTGALVAVRTETGPGDEMAVRWEPAHVGADLGDDDLRADVPDTGDRRHLFNGGSKGRDACFDLPIDRGDGCVESIDLIEMKTQQEAMVLGHTTAKSLAQLPL